MLLVLLLVSTMATPWLYMACGILAVSLLLFHSLAVEVDERWVHVAFGVGLIRRSIPLERIASCDVVRTPWYFGWGVRYVFRGWMWNVSGFDAVELTYRSGGHFRIGTDDAASLAAAIDRACAAAAQQAG